MRQFLVGPKAITWILFLQIIPLIVFPLTSFTSGTQEWWLPVVLAVLVIVAVFQLVFRRSLQAWPWYLFSFSQGFNIISRLMMLMPHATYNLNGHWIFDISYVGISGSAMILSALLLWYIEWPEVRMGLARQP